MANQRFSSNLLTHFAAREKQSEDDRYQVLKKILTSGWLLAKNLIDCPKEELPERIKRIEYAYLTDVSLAGFDLHIAFLSDVVCFTDIPILDLPIHIEKYSNFGIAFKKSFLITKGANPVFYISKNSINIEDNSTYEDHYRKIYKIS